jgi:hypothetical protein
VSDLTLRLKKLHAGQDKVMAQAARYNVLKIGRRFGKTTLAVNELLPEIALQGKPCAYYAPTYKDLHDVWLELRHVMSDLIVSKNEQTKQMRLITGGVIDFWSMDEPDSGRGRKYARVVVDEAEKARKFREAWTQTIMPTLMDYKGDAWILSTPKFGQTFFKELFHKEDPTWQRFNLSTYDNPHIDEAEIDHLRQQLDDLTFRCEILAEDVNMANNPFTYAFDPLKHVVSVEYDPRYHLHLSFDFNVDPITCIAVQHMDGCIRVVKEFYLRNSDIYQLCEAIIAAFPKATYIVTGDATGASRSALTSGNYGYYDVVARQLGLGRGQMKQPAVNPSIRDTRVLCNSLLQNYCVQIDKECQWLTKDLQYVEVDDEGDIIKDRRTDLRKADMLDCFRYYCNSFHRDWIRLLG